MKRYLIVPALATVLMAGAALAQTQPPAGDGAAPPAATEQPGGPGDGPWGHGHGHFGMWRHHEDPLASLPKPLTADSVKQALEAAFAKRPQVKSVTQSAPNILHVEIQMPDGKVRAFEINETTGARRPAW